MILLSSGISDFVAHVFVPASRTPTMTRLTLVEGEISRARESQRHLLLLFVHLIPTL